MRPFIAVVLVGVLLPCHLSAQDADLDKLQGTWDLVTLNLDGKEIPAERIKAAKLQTVYKGNNLSRVNNAKKSDSAAIKIDSSKSPKHLDTTNKDGVTEVGIYKLNGDSLTICTRTESGKERPTKFEPNADKTILTTWKRVQP